MTETYSLPIENAPNWKNLFLCVSLAASRKQCHNAAWHNMKNESEKTVDRVGDWDREGKKWGHAQQGVAECCDERQMVKINVKVNLWMQCCQLRLRGEAGKTLLLRCVCVCVYGTFLKKITDKDACRMTLGELQSFNAHSQVPLLY